MEAKLTIQEAAMYLGQEIEYGAVHTRDVLTVELLAEIKRFKNPYFQLILRSIEDMTDQERQRYRMLQTTSPNMGNHYFDMYARVTNYLRSIGVDCDELIKQGKAIRKEIK